MSLQNVSSKTVISVGSNEMSGLAASSNHLNKRGVSSSQVFCGGRVIPIWLAKVLSRFPNAPNLCIAGQKRHNFTLRVFTISALAVWLFMFALKYQSESLQWFRFPHLLKFGSKRNLMLYELYYDSKAYAFLHKNPPFQGVSVVSNETQPESNDIDASSYLPILKYPPKQKLLCEYGAMFALDTNLEKFQRGAPWIGFQSWRAKEKHLVLDGVALQSFERHLSRRPRGLFGQPKEKKVFFYWATLVTWATSADFVESCTRSHSNSCVTTFSRTLYAVLVDDGPIRKHSLMKNASVNFDNFLAPLPLNHKGWAFCSYFVMHKDHFASYIDFARMFFVTLETFWEVNSNPEACPLLMYGYSKTLCWCFLMERLVNIWVYHTGTHMYWVDAEEGSNTGNVEEVLRVSNRERVDWMSLEHIQKVKNEFPKRLSKQGKQLYKDVGGEIGNM